jgi:hypothetical protein
MLGGKSHGMRTISLIVCLTLFIFALAAYAGEDFKFPIYEHVSGYGITNTWFVALSRVEKSAGWDEKGEPQLPVGKAVSIAKAWVVSKGGSTNSYVDNIVFRSVDRGYPHSKLRPFWFYNIQFHDVYMFGSSVTCIVLLDGSVVEPESKPHTGRIVDYLD